ncbi:OPT oligopeptide transporter [Kockovaella imperatae]|uniref:OPT oligopeptide transporter n=1 Tax=Kockovaella imperatae TaxID=4999 RepID=A0A1Y1UI24_9TREE|nr:OPT oligopeptide transporter [Kockovaella imperatae]ORX37672.1 OPT oligopeptide transporter [Kockovaella imperatae]
MPVVPELSVGTVTDLEIEDRIDHLQQTLPEDEKDSHKNPSDGESGSIGVKENGDDDFDSVIIRTGADASEHLLSVRDDGDPALTFRSIVLGTAVSAFQAVMNQIYNFKPTSVSIGGSFIVLISYFLGRAWAAAFPRGDLLEKKFREKHTDHEPLPLYIKAAKFINPSDYGLKEHGIASITAGAASNGTAAISVFATQDLFYPGNTLTPLTAILGTLSIGLFGYGLTGLFSPITINSPEAVYWTNIPTLSVLQGLHWNTFKQKRMRAFWIAFGFMTLYEVIPGYMFPWLNSVSIPCLAGMNATGRAAEVITNLFGGSLSNEGLGFLSFSFDWQYITSSATSLPLIMQANQAVGIIIAYIAMSAVYYGNAWGAKALPFMSTSLRHANGTLYHSSAVFVDGQLDLDALESYGLPHLAGTYVWASMIGTAAIGALIGHCFFFWGGNIVNLLKTLRRGESPDRHFEAMRKYKSVPWYWFSGLLVLSFVFGLAVVLKDSIGLTAGAYVIALIIGTIIAPFSTILYSRFGSGVATNQLMKMLAGIIIPGRPLGNLYFTAWSHSVIAQSLNLAGDMKLGVYLKIPQRTMFLTQIWGTVFGAFINYAVMISIVNSRRELLLNPNGDYAWSGQAFQSLNNQATTWALAKYLYSAGDPYVLVPVGLAIGFGLVMIHRGVYQFLPRIRDFDIRDINVPIIVMYSGWMGYNQTQTSPIISTLLAGFIVQYYLRNYRPRIFKNYSYLVTAGLDGGSLLCMFILSFAVFGAAGSQHPFPSWWGNPADGYPDHCPIAQ